MNNLDKVYEFHEKHGFARDKLLGEEVDPEAGNQLEAMSRAVAAMADGLEAPGCRSEEMHCDSRMLRAHLILEEVAEILHALAERNKVNLADGLADLEYVTHGCAVSYGIPGQRVFDEVHRSNMTKSVVSTDPSARRLRDKGPDYEPPDIQGAMGLRQGVGVPPMSAGGVVNFGGGVARRTKGES